MKQTYLQIKEWRNQKYEIIKEQVSDIIKIK